MEIHKTLFRNVAAPLALSIGVFFLLTLLNLLLTRERERASEVHLFQAYSEALAWEFDHYFLSGAGAVDAEERELPSTELLMASLQQNIHSALAAEAEKQGEEWHLVSFVIGAIVVGTVTFFLAGKAARHFSIPLEQLAKMVKQMGKGDFTGAVDLSGKEREFRELSEAFRIMNDQLVNAIDRIASEASARAAAAQELADARKIRESLLPDAAIDVADFLRVTVSPEKMTMPGEFYDYCRFNEDVWAVITGVISGDWGDASLKLAVLSALFEHAAIRAVNEEDFFRRMCDEWENDPVLQGTEMKAILLLFHRNGNVIQLKYARPEGIQEIKSLPSLNSQHRLVHFNFGDISASDNSGILTVEWHGTQEAEQ